MKKAMHFPGVAPQATMKKEMELCLIVLWSTKSRRTRLYA